MQVSKPVQNFGSAIVIHMIFPILPVIMDLTLGNAADEKSLLIAAIFYSTTIALSSRDRLQFSLGLLFALAVTVSYMQQQNGVSKNLAILAIAVIFLYHATERYRRHVVDKEPFFLFEDKKSSESE